MKVKPRWKNNILKYTFQQSKKKRNTMSKIEISWKKQNRQLDSQAQINVQLKKQINKQTDIDSLVQNSINDKIYQLKQEALLLTKKSQNQKQKFLELETIIKTIKLRMDDQHKLQASSVTDTNFLTIEGYERKIKKYEYDLEQINSKANKINSIVNEKKQKISLLRTDRVIDSSIFKNIQKELISAQMEFKKLLIDKIRHQKVYEDCLKEYNSLKTKAQQYFQSQQNQQKSQLTSQQNPDQQSYILEGANYNNINNNKFKEIQRISHNRNILTQSEMGKQEQNYYYEFKVKKFLMNLNLNSGKQFVFAWNNIDEVNQKYFTTLNTTGDKINFYEEEITKIQKTIHESSMQFYKPKTNPTKNQLQALKCLKIKKEIEKTHLSAIQQVSTLNQFMENSQFTQLAKYVNLQDSLSKDVDLETFTELLKSIDTKMSQLNFYQVPKLNDESTVVVKTTRTDKQKRGEKLEDVINRIKNFEESDKIMKKQEFKEDYRRMMEASSIGGSRNMLKKKTKKVN